MQNVAFLCPKGGGEESFGQGAGVLQPGFSVPPVFDPDFTSSVLDFGSSVAGIASGVMKGRASLLATFTRTSIDAP
jgi:hypothetical protein